MAARQVSSTREVALPQCLPAGERRSGSAAVRGRKAARARSSGWGNSKRPAPKAERRPAPATRRRFSAPGLDAGGKLRSNPTRVRAARPRPIPTTIGRTRVRRRSADDAVQLSAGRFLRGRIRNGFIRWRQSPRPSGVWLLPAEQDEAPCFLCFASCGKSGPARVGPTQSAASATINTNSLKLSIRL